MRKFSISVVIPNWNGEKLLRKNLHSLLSNLPNNSEVIVVDNGSTDNSLFFLKQLKKIFKKIKFVIIRNKENFGVTISFNQGFKRASNEFILLINNDVLPQKDFLKPAIKHFKDKRVFAVSLHEAGDKWAGWAKIFWSKGYFNYLPGGVTKKAHISGWASGGCSIFRKSIWKKLEGFDEMFAPFYWEDLDIGYRAWKRGYKILWEPKAKVVHKHEASTSKIEKRYLNLIKERNQLLFIWKNISDPWLRFTHIFGMFFRVMNGPNYLKVIFSAIRQYRRFGKPKEKNTLLSDKQVFSFFK